MCMCVCVCVYIYEIGNDELISSLEVIIQTFASSLGRYNTLNCMCMCVRASVYIYIYIYIYIHVILGCDHIYACTHTHVQLGQINTCMSCMYTYI